MTPSLPAWIPPWLASRVLACSVEAIRVLAALDARQAYSQTCAMTHAKIASLTGLQARAIVDLTGELIRAGVPVATSCAKPQGCWIAHAEMQHFRRNRKAQQTRGVRNLLRARDMKRCCELWDQHARPADSTGQLALGLPAAADKPRWRDN